MHDPANIPLEVLCHDVAMKPDLVLDLSAVADEESVIKGSQWFLQVERRIHVQVSTVYQFHNI